MDLYIFCRPRVRHIISDLYYFSPPLNSYCGSQNNKSSIQMFLLSDLFLSFFKLAFVFMLSHIPHQMLPEKEVSRDDWPKKDKYKFIWENP